ncbi:MAG TPA: hypothetical protein PKE29_01670 [Phycisphaerales bacterium]|nr:hypothetical protein [Phycisphaerales bacterium]
MANSSLPPDPPDPLDLGPVDRAIRINEIEQRLEDMGAESMGVSGDCPPDIQEQFLSGVLAYETAPVSCQFDRLVQDGIELPSPDSLDEAALHAKLWEIVHALAARDVYLERTDHLSDRELYEHLWSDSLREEVPIMPAGSGWINHIDILGGCSEEDIQLAQRYYDDEETRRRWAEDFPDDTIPPHEDPPFQRDRLLPRPPEPGAGEMTDDPDDEDHEP